MTFVDSHCHLDRLDLNAHNGKLESAIQLAQAQGVNQMLCVCIDLDNFSQIHNIALQYDFIHASAGVHPTEKVDNEPTIDTLVALSEKPKVVAIGETGLDYFHCKGDVTWQQDRFRTHIHAAIQANKPLIIHTRDAREDTLQIMQDENAAKVGGVMHCFTETWEMANAAMAMGFYISFSGIVTFKNAVELQDVAKHVPLDKMLIETDAPYLAPAPFRGKPNQPAYVPYIAEKIATLKGISVEEVAAQTTQNYFKLFKL